MEFCDICENMLFLECSEVEGEPSKLFYQCKKCGNEKPIESQTVVSSMTFSKREQYSSVINKYTKLDPTLPRIRMLQCPKEECVNHTAKDPEIIYVRYDNTELKYAYLCPICDTVWKTDKK